MQGPLTGFHHDRHNITRTAARTWSRSSYTTDPADCAMKRLQDRHRRTCQRTHQGSLPGSHTINEKLAPRHSERDPTRTKCREVCVSDFTIRTAPRRERIAPQLERSDTHKVTGCGFQPLFRQGLQSTAPAMKNEPRQTAAHTLCEPVQSKRT